MGEVYRARDLKLQRDVALKVLPDAVARDADRRARFERESHVLAALNHPHIAAIYGVAENQGVTALVLELVEGPTLEQRLIDGALPLEETAAIARQIVEALEAAHEAGIVHRDLKPANIKLRADGSVKVLDFGLAKAIEGHSTISAELSHLPTAVANATAAGLILGTAAYMAPEQARGRPVDKRADIWAFGVVLWEMLTGRSLFAVVDSRGFRPLVLGRLGSGMVVASETCALDLVGASMACELQPGEFVRIDDGRVAELPRLAPRPVSRCVFELVYFARPDSTVFGADGGDALGRSVAFGDVNHDGKADLIMGATGGDGSNNNCAGCGDVYIVFGEPSPPAVYNLASSGVADVRLFGASADDLVAAFYTLLALALMERLLAALN